MEKDFIRYEDRVNWVIGGTGDEITAIRNQTLRVRQAYPNLKLAYIKRRAVELGLVALMRAESTEEDV